MVKDAEMNKEADSKRKEIIEARNNAESLIYQTRKSLDEFKDLDEAEKGKILSAIEALEAALKKDDATKEEIDALTKTLSEASHALAERMYAKKGGDAGAQDKKKDDDVIDAEVE